VLWDGERSYTNATIRDTDLIMEPLDGAVKTVPQVIENYSHFEPPRQLLALIEELLNGASKVFGRSQDHFINQSNRNDPRPAAAKSLGSKRQGWPC